MRPRYIAARRGPGRPCRHLTTRRLQRMRTRFRRALAGSLLLATLAMVALW